MKHLSVIIISLLCVLGMKAQTFDVTKPLLTQASQLTSNANSKACDSSEGHLIDGNIETYFHTSWNTYGGSALPNAKHYLQWHLNAPISEMIFTFTGMTWTSAHNSPKDVTIYATNTPSVEPSWTKVINLTNMTPDDIPSHYTSPLIVMTQAYSDMRMVVNATTTGQVEGTYGQQYFCLSEFQVYESADSITAYSRLQAYMLKFKNITFEGGTTPGYYELSKVQDFNTALAAAKAATSEMTDEEIATLQSNLENAYAAVQDAIIPICEGYYYIICSDKRFSVTKSLVSDWAMRLGWGSFNADSPKSVFHIKPLPSGNYAIQSFYSGGYVGTVKNGSTAFPMTDSLVTEQVITLLSANNYHINSTSYPVAYHMLDHYYGSGEQGDIIAWQNNAYDFSLFRLQQVDSTKLETLAKMRDDELEQMDSTSVGIVFIGNSITYGAGTTSVSTYAAPVVTGKLVSEKTGRFVAIRNCGLSGSTTVDWLPGKTLMNNALEGAKALRRCGQLWFSIMLGTNDSAETGPTGSPVSVSTYRYNLLKIVNKLLEEYPEARVVVNYPIWYSPNTHNGATYLESGLKRLQTYHPVITQCVNVLQKAEKKVYAGNIETYSYFENQNSLFTPEAGYSGTFYLHPNNAGAAKLGEFWANTIVDIINDDPLGVEDVSTSAPQESSRVYSLNGLPITNPRQGEIYIRNGKKILQTSLR